MEPTIGPVVRLAKLLGPELRDTLAQDPEQLREALEDFPAEDIAELLEDLPKEDAVALFQRVPHEMAANVIERMDEEDQARILGWLNTDDAAEVLALMAADDRVDVIQEMPSRIAEQVLEHIEEVQPDLAEDTRELINYEEDSAGGLMTTEYVALDPHTKVWKAIEAVREYGQSGRAETIYYAYVVAFRGQLVGVVSLRDLILSDPGVAVEDVMTENVVRVSPLADQEEVAATAAKYDLPAMPVVDDAGHMLGLVTVDDLMDVVVEEATEDAQLAGAVQPIEDPYFDVDLWTFFIKRAPWLIVLFAGELLTASVMERYEHDLATLVDLVIFIPLIISSGGNSGSQSSSLVIRALAVGEVRPSDWVRILYRELAMGLALGLTLGVVGFGRAYMIGDQDPLSMAIAVSGSIVAVVTCGTLVGSLLPLLIKRLGFDPAVSSTPFIASLVDVLGLLVYFSIARIVFAHLLA